MYTPPLIGGTQDAGVLPELKAGDHGQMQTMPVINPSQTAFYPFSARLGVIPEKMDVVYWYNMEKQDDAAEWRVVKIWKTDKKNTVLADNLPLPAADAQLDANAKLRKKKEDWKNSQPSPAGDGAKRAAPEE